MVLHSKAISSSNQPQRTPGAPLNLQSTHSPFALLCLALTVSRNYVCTCAHRFGARCLDISRGRRWHALAHMLGIRPCDMKPKMRKMIRFGMLEHFFNNSNTDACVKTCDLQCTFVSDITFADDTVMKPNQSFNKK